ncbi:hypothetical protein AcV7_000585 [Taiwanofungus camphoratus]|nr:hypothetical protein AcV7_000585 [Antrodia cinnamomea]
MAESKFSFPVYNSMEALPEASRIRAIYPDDFFPNGTYVQLPYGRVRFWLLGPEEGTRVVLIHGVSTPSVTWKYIAPYLAAHGMRVLVYDLYGKGYSEAPQTAHHVNLFITQLALLMQYVRWDSAHIVGFSMGGGIAAAFAAILPHLVTEKLVLMASAGVHDRPSLQPEKPSNQAAPKTSMPMFQELVDLQAELLPGYKPAVASCFRDGPIHDLLWAFDGLEGLHVGYGKALQVLIIHGTADDVIRFSDTAEIRKRVPSAQLVGIKEAGHQMTVQDGHWQQVAESLQVFLN